MPSLKAFAEDGRILLGSEFLARSSPPSTRLATPLLPSQALYPSFRPVLARKAEQPEDSDEPYLLRVSASRPVRRTRTHAKRVPTTFWRTTPQLDQRLRPPAHARASAAGLDNPCDVHLPPRRVSLRHGSLSSWAIACPAPATSDFLTSATITPAGSSRLIQSRLCRPNSAPLSTVAIRSRDGKGQTAFIACTLRARARPRARWRARPTRSPALAGDARPSRAPVPGPRGSRPC